MSLALALLASSLLAPSAHAQAPLINGLGGTAGYGTSCIGQNDDGSSNPIAITAFFPGGLRFFDTTHTSLHLNTNGNITFAGPLPTFTPNPFPVASRPMIAPFWADVDTRRSEETCIGFFCVPGCSGPGDGEAVIGPACDNPSQNGIWWHLEAASGSRPARAIFTWDRVGYYQCHENLRASFQLVLTSAAGCGPGGGAGTDFDVEFRFNRCDWETGDASGGSGGFGGTPAQSGFDAGNSRDFVEIMGSRTAGIARRLCTESNVGTPGVWRFNIRGGVVMCPDAGMPCVVPGQRGACADGRTNCVGGGTECVQQVMPSDERCDAVDNDCDGSVDESSDTLCSAGEVCESGTCLAACFELGCPSGQVCLPSGRCIDESCVEMTCPEGQRCEAGACVGACDGVVCPIDRTCRGGVCTDACAGLTCDECTVCDEGLCTTRCQLGSCRAGETCQDDGRCVETSCAAVSCAPSEACRGGACVDRCSGAVCPRAQMCAAGECVPMDAPPPPADGGAPIGSDGGTIPAPLDAGGMGTDGGPPRPPPRGGGVGCACRAAVPPARGFRSWWLLGVVALVMTRLNRRAGARS